MKTPPASLVRLWPAVLLLLALALRVYGIDWGLPDRDRLFSYHVDESLVVAAARAANPFALQLDTGFYNYGQWYLLAVSALLHTGEGLRLIAPPIAPTTPSTAGLLAARLFTALLGAATVLVLRDVGNRRFGRPAGDVAAVLYAIAPLPVQHAHFATVDVPATFWIAAALALAGRHADAPTAPRWLLLAGLASGLAAATKYNAGLVTLAGAAAWWCAAPRKPLPLAALVGGAAVGFLVGCPGALVNPTLFRDNLLFEVRHMGAGSENLFVGTPPGWVYHLTFNLPWALGLPLTVAALAGVGLALARRRAADGMLAAFALPYFLMVGAAQVKFARYCLPLLPPLLLWAGALSTVERFRRPVRIGLAACGAFALALTGGFNHALAGPDPRDQAAAYLKGVASLAFARRPWFWSPPVAPQLSHFSPDAAYRSALAFPGPPRLIAPDLADEWRIDLLTDAAPDALALSELEYADVLRLHEQKAVSYVERARELLPNRHTFATPIALFGVTLVVPDDRAGLPLQRLPHDMLYTNPTVVVLER